MMDPRSSNGFQLENEPTWELGKAQNQNLYDEHSSQELETIQVENPVPFSNGLNNSSDEILRYIDQILMEDDLEQHIMLRESSDFRAKERSLYEAIGQKYPPSPQQESSSLINGAQYVDDDDANNTDEVIIEKNSHSEAMDNNFPMQEFDESVWMYTVDEKLAAEMANMGIMRSNVMQPAGGAKTRTKKRRNNGEKDDEVVDLRALLIDCSKFVSSGDGLAANDLLRKIRQHSSPYGDGIQRLAHYFADGLEARLAGIIHKSTDSSDYLRAYHMSYSPSMTRKIFSFASNEMIAIRSEKAARIHVIDFGILYGIQWPSFIRRVAGREGGPPKRLRITGIEFPQVAKIIEDTGSRLARYAEALGVPFEFEYKAIAREWETIKTDDLKIEKDEFVAVVCSIRSMRLLDETVRMAESPRSMFLKLVREINPDIFVHMIMNGAFNQPLFTYRFRDLLLHCLSVFDILETLVPRDQPERMVIERDLVGEDILNVVACEGPERVLRPETYRQWQVRNLKAGFMKIPFERKLIDAITCKTSNLYHKDFLIFEENQWMMMSWKGRPMYAISCWQPVAASGI